MRSFLFFLASVIATSISASKFGAALSTAEIAITALGLSGAYLAIALLLKAHSIAELKLREQRALSSLAALQSDYSERFGSHSQPTNSHESHAGHHVHQAHQVGHLVGGEAGGWIGAGVVAGAHLASHMVKSIGRYFSTTPEQRQLEREMGELWSVSKKAADEVSMKRFTSIAGAVFMLALFVLISIYSAK